mmetsp:Transcript_6630/g.11695  ORF Transcript_6630/g.11695 Transcript_6630/m.11695 type:complete len:211 (+) Transcript_6630:323-955(+)
MQTWHIQMGRQQQGAQAALPPRTAGGGRSRRSGSEDCSPWSPRRRSRPDGQGGADRAGGGGPGRPSWAGWAGAAPRRRLRPAGPPLQFLTSRGGARRCWTLPSGAGRGRRAAERPRRRDGEGRPRREEAGSLRLQTESQIGRCPRRRDGTPRRRRPAAEGRTSPPPPLRVPACEGERPEGAWAGEGRAALPTASPREVEAEAADGATRRC